MWRTTRLLLRTSAYAALDLFAQVQLGATPVLTVSRQFVLDHFSEELPKRQISHARLLSMDARQMAQLLKQLFFDRYLAVPFRLFTFDLEFTAIPTFTPKGPTEEIIEMAFYHPDTDELFGQLVRPKTKKINPETEKLTGISSQAVKMNGVAFEKAWNSALEFIHRPRENEHQNSSERILLLSHGGKLSDVSMLQWAAKECKIEIPKHFVFGDTYHLIRDIHRKRPVTPDRHPPSWGLEELASWLKLRNIPKAHRAAADAKLTWTVLSTTLLRYGHEALDPKQQLVSRFFDEQAKKSFEEFAITRGASAADDQQEGEDGEDADMDVEDAEEDADDVDGI